MSIPSQTIPQSISPFTRRWLAVLASSLVFAGCPPVTVAQEMKPGHSHGTTGAKTHSHKAVEVPPGKPVPTVNLMVRPDAMSGWNLQVKVTNFTFAPERVNTKSTSVNEGHAHLYVNGKKVSRLYGPWYHLVNLPPGSHNIMVTLNTNDHGDLMHRGKPIQDTKTIQVPAK